MSWFKRPPTAEKKATDAATARLEAVRKVRKSLLAEVLERLQEIPVEEGIVGVGEAIWKKDRL